MSDDFKTCVMIGLGYIGLPTAAVIARTGITVLGVDINQRDRRHDQLRRMPDRGEGPARAGGRDGRRRAALGRDQPSPGDVFVIAVPTPFEGTYKPDLSYVEAATRSIAPVLAKGNLVLLESTIPVGTTEQAARWIEMLRPDLTVSHRGSEDGRVADVLVAHCPERVLPGQMLRELVENDRVIGGVCKRGGRAGPGLLQDLRQGRLPDHRRAHGGALQADRERLPRRQHRLRQRAVGDLRGIRHQRLGADRPRQPSPARQHPAARPRRRRPLHRRRPVVHRLGHGRQGAADPRGALDQQRPAAAGGAEGAGEARGGGGQHPLHRLLRPLLQAQHRRRAREPGDRGGRVSREGTAAVASRRAVCRWSSRSSRRCRSTSPASPT